MNGCARATSSIRTLAPLSFSSHTVTMFDYLRRWLGSDHAHETSDEAVIRTHLANERTFLAWLRTAVVLLGVGLGAIALGTGEGAQKVLAFSLGGFTVFAGVLMIAWAYISFKVTLDDIGRRRYRPRRHLILVASTLLITTGLIIIVLLAAEIFGF